MTKSVVPPVSVKQLDQRLQSAAGERGQTLRRLRRALANTIVGQLLPAGVVKGGTGIKLRLGEGASRYTPDLDAARGGAIEAFEEAFETALLAGWNGFTGRLIKGTKRAPEEVPEHYVMQPYQVKMTYRSKSWLTVDFELGHDEIQCTADAERHIAPDLVALFVEVGLPEPGQVPVITRHHQIAQKLHACTSPGSERAHDLVDLQLLTDESLAYDDVAATTERLFRFRQQHTWPASITPDDRWATLYAEAARGLAVLPDLPSAILWGQEFISRVVAAGSPEYRPD